MDTALVRTTRSAIGIALGASLAALAASAAPGVAQEPAPATVSPKIAVVNVDFVAGQSPSGQALQREIQALRDQYASELETHQEEVRRIEQRVAAADSLSADEKRALERQYQDALTNVQRYQQDVQEKAQRMQAEGLADIRKEIGPILEAIMEEEGYDLVLNSQNAAVVLASDRIDITQAVLARLQAATPGG